MWNKLIFSCLAAGICLAAKAQEGQVPDAVEREALNAFFKATTETIWHQRGGWRPNVPVKDWYGVTVENGDVVALVLNGNNLTGRIPAAFYQLTALETLDLGGNALRGEINHRLGGLGRLTSLNLSHNQLTGEIPKSIGQLGQLATLDLGHNGLSGPIPEAMWDLNGLEALRLNNNALSGPLSPQIANLAGLARCMLQENLLTGPLPAQIAAFADLERLNVSYNLMEGPLPPNLGDMPNVTHLGLAGNAFTGRLPGLHGMVGLHEVDVSRTLVYDLGSLGSHPNIANMHVLMVETPTDFADLASLHNDLDDTGPAFLRFFPFRRTHLYFDPATLTYSVEVGGHDNRFVWYKNGIRVRDDAQASYTVPAVDYRPEDKYECVVRSYRFTSDKIYILHCQGPVVANQYHAVRDGDWHDQIWARKPGGPPAEGVPSRPGHTVYIKDRTVTVHGHANAGDVRVQVENGPATLLVDGHDLTVNGELSLTKINEGYPGHVKTANGGRIITADP